MSGLGFGMNRLVVNLSIYRLVLNLSMNRLCEIPMSQNMISRPKIEKEMS